jgi:hypothetical protein
MRSALLIMFLTLLVVAANSAEAIDVSEMKRTMASNSCPPNPTRVDPISAAQVCAATYSRPCNATSNQCFDENQRCVAEVNKENYVIGDYNVYIAKCQAADANRQGGNKFTPNSSLSTERQRQESEAKAAQEAAIKAQARVGRSTEQSRACRSSEMALLWYRKHLLLGRMQKHALGRWAKNSLSIAVQRAAFGSWRLSLLF